MTQSDSVRITRVAVSLQSILDETCREMAGYTQAEAVEVTVCVGCDGPAARFKDELSRVE